MSVPYNAIISSSYVSNGTSQLISVPSDITKFEVYSITQFGSTASNTDLETASWVSGLPAGSAYLGSKTSGAATIALTSMATANGFTLVTTPGVPGAPIATMATTAAAPAVVSTGTTTGLVASSTIVRVYDVAGMQQISGLDFTVGTISASTSFQLKYLDASGFAAAGTSGEYRIIPFDPIFYPRRRYITGITAASSAVVTLSVTHGFTVGQLVRVIVPAAFGMTQINGLLGTITAINTSTNTITLNINSTAFTAFAFPTSAQAAAGVTFAQIVPVGEAATAPYQNLLDDATVNQGATYLQLGSSVVGTSGDTMQWIAYRALSM